MNPFKATFVMLGLVYAGLFTGGVAGSLPNVPTIGVLGILWCALGWSVVHRLIED
jgi:hypothetical protein